MNLYYSDQSRLNDSSNNASKERFGHSPIRVLLVLVGSMRKIAIVNLQC